MAEGAAGAGSVYARRRKTLQLTCICDNVFEGPVASLRMAALVVAARCARFHMTLRLDCGRSKLLEGSALSPSNIVGR